MMLSLDLSKLPANISPHTVRRALRSVCYGRPLVGSPLLSLRALDALTPPDDAARAMALRDHLAGVTWQCLADTRRHHGVAEPWLDRHSLSALAGLGMLQHDFLVGSADLETWSYLYFRYFVKSGRSLRDIAKLLSTTNRTLERRLIAGHARLAEALFHGELLIVESAAAEAMRPAVEASAPPSRRARAPVEGTAGGPDPQDRPAADALPAGHGLGDLAAYHRDRIARATLGRHPLAERIVPLRLSVEGADPIVPSGPFLSLCHILDAVPDPALLLLGPPGSGKSTLLRWLAYTLSVEALAERTDRVPVFVELSRYGADGTDGAPPRPLDWLSARWAAHGPELPPLETLMRAGRLLFLLDAVDEIPHPNETAHAERLRAWKHFLFDELTVHPGNRAVISCRTTAHRVALSTANFPMTRVHIEGLGAEEIRSLIERHNPEGGRQAAEVVIGGPLLDLARSPFMAGLLAQPDVDVHRLGCAEVLTRYVRHALVREIASDNPVFTSSVVLTRHDRARIMNARRWPTPWDLPDDGPLFRRLAAFALQLLRTDPPGTPACHSRSHAVALAMLGDAAAAHILDAGHALGVIDIDLDRNEVCFSHALWQAYFAARALASEPVSAGSVAPHDVEGMAASIDDGTADGWAVAPHFLAQMSPDRHGTPAGGPAHVDAP